MLLLHEPNPVSAQFGGYPKSTYDQSQGYNNTQQPGNLVNHAQQSYPQAKPFPPGPPAPLSQQPGGHPTMNGIPGAGAHSQPQYNHQAPANGFAQHSTANFQGQQQAASTTSQSNGPVPQTSVQSRPAPFPPQPMQSFPSSNQASQPSYGIGAQQSHSSPGYPQPNACITQAPQQQSSRSSANSWWSFSSEYSFFHK
ncbi:hypothetical protein COOONC_20528 [Cooperia oncophora]